MIYKINNMSDQRPAFLNYLKENSFPRVVDVGGTDFPWAYKYVNAYLDMRSPQEVLDKTYEGYRYAGRAKVFLGDVNDDDGWKEIKQDVADNGKYDFVICSHLLEDLRNPQYVIRQLPKIAKAGYVGFPSVHWELGIDTERLNTVPENKNMENWGVSRTFRGFLHHRWILTVKGGVLWLFPKSNVLEVIEGFEWVKGLDARHELTFFWKNDLPYKTFKDDYMGPNGGLTCQEYREQLTPEDFNG